MLIKNVNKKLGAVKREVEVKPKKKGKLRIKCDEMWSFVGDKGNKQWIWLAIDVFTFINCRSIYWQKRLNWCLRALGFTCERYIVNVV